MDTRDPDLQALLVTVGLASALTDSGAGTAEWQALTDALLAEHTAPRLASMLTGACALLARAGLDGDA